MGKIPVVSPDPVTKPVSPPATGWRRLASRWWVKLARDVAFVAAIVLVAGLFQTRDHVRGAAPAVTLRALDGGAWSPESLRGRPAMVVFWAPWCGVCRAQADNVARVARWAGARAGVVQVAAAYGDEAEVRAYAREHGVDPPVLLADEAAAHAFRVEVFPTIYFLDAEGRVKGSAAGYTTTAGMLWRLFF